MGFKIMHDQLTCLISQIVNPKGEMKGSAITGPVGKEAAELWPVRHPVREIQSDVLLIVRSVSRVTPVL